MQKKLLSIIISLLLLLTLVPLIGRAVLAVESGETGAITETAVVLNINVSPSLIDFGMVAPGGSSPADPMDRTITVDSTGANCDQLITTEILGEVQTVAGEKLNYGNGTITEFGPTDYTPISEATVYLDGIEQMSGVTVYESTGMVTFAAAPASGVLVTINYTSSSTFYSEYMKFNDPALPQPPGPEVKASAYARELLFGETATIVMDIYPPQDYPIGVNPYEIGRVVFYAEASGAPHCILTITTTGNGDTDPAEGFHAYEEGEVVPITATADPGWEFDSWTGDVATVADVNNVNTTVTMNGDYTITANFTEIIVPTYNLTIAVNGSGSTTPTAGVHTYNEGDVVDLNATPAAGWEFVNWSGGMADPNSANTTVIMDSDKSVTANFVQITHNLTYTAGSNGTLTGNTAQTVNEGEDGTPVTAVPDAGYQFVDWSDGITDNPRTDTNVTSDISVTANFAQTTHDLTMAISGSGSTTPAAGVHTYNEGDVVDITATPAAGWEFDSWTSGVADPNSASTTVLMDADKTVTANFAQIPHDLTMAVNGSGSTTPAAGVHTYNEGDVVDITATPAAGWEFVNWSGGVVDPNSANSTVIMDSDKSVTANFTQITHNLTYMAGPNGTLTGDTAQTVNEGEDGTPVTAVPDAGYQFVDWSDGITDNPRTDTNVTSDISVTANFVQITHDLTMAVNGSGSTTPAAGVHTYNEGDVVNINATPAAGWEFDSWSGDVADPNSASTTVLVDADKTVTANFIQITHNLTYAAGLNGTLTGDTAQTVNEGEDGTPVTAVPDAGYQFVDWSDGITDNPRTDTNVTSDISVTANFVQITHDLTMAVNGSGSTTPAAGVHTYNEGDVVDINATPAAGWEFVNWSGGVADSNSASTTVLVDADKSVTANFTQIPHDLTMVVSGSGSTTPAAGMYTYNEGDVVDITATPAAGWEFDSWSGDVADPNSASTTVLMNADKTVTANFIQITHNLTYAAGLNGTLTGDTAQTVNEGEDGTPVTAVPDAGYQFVDWSDGITDNPRTDTNVTSDISVTANFVQITHDLTMAVNGSGSTTPAAGVHTYNEGDVVDINATPAAGWEFVNWSGGVADSNSASTTVLVDADKSVTANFTQIPHDLTMAVSGSGSTTPAAGVHTYYEGDVVDITAIAGPGWEFDSWTGDVANPNSASTTVLVDANKTVTAIFAHTNYILTIDIVGNGSVTFDPLPPYYIGDDTQVTLTAIADPGWTFSHWEGDLQGTATTRKIKMTGDMTVIAVFMPAV